VDYADDDIGVNSHTGQNPIATKDWVRRQCGLPAWEPKKRKLKPLPPLVERNQFLSESLRIARDRERIAFEQFALIINDLKNACSDDTLKARAGFYAREFSFGPAEIEAALHPAWRAYTAPARAAIFQVTYDEYRRLGLRRSGCIEHDRAERRRLTKQRYNAKRQAERTTNRVSKSAARRAPLCPSSNVGTIRVPSSEGVAGLVARRSRKGSLDRKIHEGEKCGARATSLGSEGLPQIQYPVRDRASLDPKRTVITMVNHMPHGRPALGPSAGHNVCALGVVFVIDVGLILASERRAPRHCDGLLEVPVLGNFVLVDSDPEKLKVAENRLEVFAGIAQGSLAEKPERLIQIAYPKLTQHSEVVTNKDVCRFLFQRELRDELIFEASKDEV
jgi:hypothetical protein